MATIDIYYPRVERARSQITEKVREYREEAGRITVAAVEMGVQWSGDARDAFMKQHTQNVEFYKKMIERLNGCADALAKASERYKQADLEAAKKIKAVKE